MVPKSSGKIFIVEDNELNMKLFCDLLKAHGYDVGFTQSANDAIEMIRRFIPDLILMDIQLQGLSGLELIKTIKEDKYIGMIPVIAVTAFAMKDDKVKIMSSGCEDYVAKPISIEPFLQTISKYLQK